MMASMRRCDDSLKDEDRMKVFAKRYLVIAFMRLRSQKIYILVANELNCERKYEEEKRETVYVYAIADLQKKSIVLIANSIYFLIIMNYRRTCLSKRPVWRLDALQMYIRLAE